MTKAKTKGVPTPARLVDMFGRKAYKMSTAMQISAQRAQYQPVLISVNSHLKYTYHGDDK